MLPRIFNSLYNSVVYWTFSTSIPVTWVWLSDLYHPLPHKLTCGVSYFANNSTTLTRPVHLKILLLKIAKRYNMLSLIKMAPQASTVQVEFNKWIINDCISSHLTKDQIKLTFVVKYTHIKLLLLQKHLVSAKWINNDAANRIIISWSLSTFLHLYQAGI